MSISRRSVEAYEDEANGVTARKEGGMRGTHTFCFLFGRSGKERRKARRSKDRRRGEER